MATVSTRNRNKDKFYKDGREKKPNWEYRFEKAKINGKRQHESQAGFRTQKEAFEAGTKALALYLNTGEIHQANSISYADFIDQWYEMYVAVNLRVSTQRKYRGMIKKHLKPALGHFKVQSIKPATLQNFINSYKEKGYSHQTITHIYVMLKKSFEYAVEPLQYIHKNPMERVQKPKMDRKRTRERYVLNQDEWKQIITRFDADNKFHIPLMIGYHTGLRIGETLGLTWDCIDFEKGTLTVNKQLLAYKAKDEPRKWTLAPPKTNASNRTIPIGKTLLNALKKEHLKQKQNKLMYGEYYKKYTAIEILPNLFEITLNHDGNNDLDLICVHEDGRFMHWDGMRYCFRVIQENLKIRFEYHALRHTHATMLVASGANIKSVQKRLGHEKIETTLQTYAHDTEATNNEAVDIFEKAICPQ